MLVLRCFLSLNLHRRTSVFVKECDFSMFPKSCYNLNESSYFGAWADAGSTDPS